MKVVYGAREKPTAFLSKFPCFIFKEFRKEFASRKKCFIRKSVHKLPQENRKDHSILNLFVNVTRLMNIWEVVQLNKWTRNSLNVERKIRKLHKSSVQMAHTHIPVYSKLPLSTPQKINRGKNTNCSPLWHLFCRGWLSWTPGRIQNSSYR